MQNCEFEPHSAFIVCDVIGFVSRSAIVVCTIVVMATHVITNDGIAPVLSCLCVCGNITLE